MERDRPAADAEEIVESLAYLRDIGLTDVEYVSLLSIFLPLYHVR